MASSAEPNSTIIFDRGSPLQMQNQNNTNRSESINMAATDLDDHPIRGLSQRSRLSNSMFQWCWLLVPLCMAFFAGMKIRTRRSLICSSGMPEIGLKSTYNSRHSYRSAAALPLKNRIQTNLRGHGNGDGLLFPFETLNVVGDDQIGIDHGSFLLLPGVLQHD